MNLKLAVGITILAYLAYLLFKEFARSNAMVAEYRRTMRDLLTNEKYQVKGKFDQ